MGQSQRLAKDRRHGINNALVIGGGPSARPAMTARSLDSARPQSRHPAGRRHRDWRRHEITAGGMIVTPAASIIIFTISARSRSTTLMSGITTMLGGAPGRPPDRS
jgi:hypothetical protein